MKIALDYDGTYTQDPDMWLKFVRDARAKGHKVYLVTMRHFYESKDMDKRILQNCDGYYFTGRMIKKPFLEDRYNLKIDVWIDDNPRFCA